ncbi:MAG: family 78 glycoside hydrolase catalytic domain [Clostridia bacterium]|nr:family 78 glycoside hydrolase catalytic domain [Clostridia bacterium]
MRVYDIKINRAAPCLNVPVMGLRFGWKYEDDASEVFQTAYRIEILKGGKRVFDTGVVDPGEESVDVSPSGLRLEYACEYVVKITSFDNKGNSASEEAGFITELSETDWNMAEWIKPAEHISGWAPYLRTKFDVAKKVSRAILWGCGLGIGEFYINGERTDDNYIDPPATNYEETLLYRAHDVTKLVKEGKNCLAVLLGEGFYSQSRVWGSNGMIFGDVCVKAVLRLLFEDGSSAEVLTGTENWKYKYSPISLNNIYAGEVYDRRLETEDFADPEGSETGWGAVRTDDTPKGALTPCLMEPVRIIREIPCIGYHCESGKSDGAWIFDMGENFAGTYEVTIPANSPRGACYVFRTSEALSEGGNLDHRSTGAFATQCIQQDMFIAGGGPEPETFRPRFTYHGFRYVEITGIHDFSKGYGTEPDPSMIKGLALSTDFKETGSFDSDCKDLNDLDKVMRNTYRSNYHGYPEDCPAREKCGWLGDAQVVCNWGILSYDSVAAYEKYLEDIRTSDKVYGVWQMIAPGKRGCGEASPLWGCAQVIIPYWLWKYAGDRHAIRANLDMMKKWLKHECDRAEDYVISVGLGDWDPPRGNEWPRRMPVPHSSTMMFYEVAKKLGEICRELGDSDEKKYFELAEKIKKSVIRHFYDAEKHSYRYSGSNGVALALGLYPMGERELLLEATLKELEEDDYAMYTGIYANKYLVPVLMEEGRSDVAMKFLFNRAHESFGTMLDAGATSMWECPDMHFVEKNRNVGVASYNHPMHGGFMASYYERIAGIIPTLPGYKHFIVCPSEVEEVNALACSVESPYGTISVNYGPSEGGVRRYVITVPAGTLCTVMIGGKTLDVKGSGEWTFDVI